MAHSLRTLAALPLGALLASAAGAQATFSIDWHGPTKGKPDSFTGSPISEGDVLGPVTGIPALGPLATPGIESARDASIETISACATGARRNAACSVPGATGRSSANRPSPRSSDRSSTRSTGSPSGTRGR